MKLKYKLPLILFAAFTVIIAATFSVSINSVNKLHREAQYEMGRAMAVTASESMKSFLEMIMNNLLAIEKAVAATMNLTDKEKDEVLGHLLTAFSDKPAVSNVYVAFERGAYMSAERTEVGHYISVDAFHPEEGGIVLDIDDSFEISDDDDWYHVSKKTLGMHLAEPYDYTYVGEERARKMITLSAPIVVDGKFIGAAGYDMELTLLQKDILSRLADPVTGGYAVLVSHEGLQAVHPQEDKMLKEVGYVMDSDEQEALLSDISSGEYRRVLIPDENTGELLLISYVPMQPEGISEPWSIGWVVPLSALQSDADNAKKRDIMVAVSCTVAWGIFLLVFMSGIFGNVTTTVDTLKKMTAGGGDLTIRLKERGKDEFGQMAAGLNGLISKLHSTIKTTQEESRKLSGTSSSLLTLSHDLSKSAEVTLDRSQHAAQESGEANGSVQEIASESEAVCSSAEKLSSTADQMDANMDTLIKNTESMRKDFADMNEVSKNSKTIADQAITEVKEAIDVMDTLGKAAREIGQFTDVIVGIAKKTNLLAINATVEAARAGEAGKGFAVVAGEVKQLASQSAANANDITQRIERIQANTTNAIDVINKISTIMGKVSESAHTISQSIERETKMSEELAENAKQTSLGAKQVVQAIAQITDSAKSSAQSASNAARGTQIVSDSINVINQNAGKVNAYSEDLKEAADSLKTMAQELDAIVSKFKT